MAEKRQVQTPAGMGGLVRYYEEEKSVVKLKPEHILYLIVAVALIEILMHLVAPV